MLLEGESKPPGNHARLSRLHQKDLNGTERQSSLELKLPPLALVVIVAALMWVASAAAPALEFFVPAKFFWLVSLVLIGVATCLSGVTSFRRAKTTVNPTKPDATSALVVSGIYKHTRNPMYVGFVLVLLGWCAFLSNLAALALVPVFIVYMNRFQIQPEERVLSSLFPDEYPAYRAKVRRWV
jgi:protein-S-isoprenylcysteine O-methyltransferase Ste14